MSQKKLLTDLLEILGRYCGESGKSEGAVETLERIINERLLMAQLAADTPKFFNPVVVWAAKDCRERILLREGQIIDGYLVEQEAAISQLAPTSSHTRSSPDRSDTNE